MKRPGWYLISRARVQGASFGLNDEARVVLDVPERFPSSLLAELRAQRDVVAAALEDEAENEEALRKWFPNYGAQVLDRETGRTGRLWGATKRGLIVDFGPGTPLLTLDPRAVEDG